jgi:adenosylcobinamide hydrolase
MKYRIKRHTLIIQGDFEAISSGVNGGRRHVGNIINHQVQPGFDHDNPVEYLDNLVDAIDIKKPYFGLLTAVNMNNLNVIRDDYLSVFVTAGITHPSVYRIHKAGTINIILVVDGTLSEGAMVGAVITATEAKGIALVDMGYDFLGTTTDAVVVAYEKHTSRYFEYAGPHTELGEKITNTIIESVSKGLRKTV